MQLGLNAIIEVVVVSFVTSSISAMTILLTGVWESGPVPLPVRPLSNRIPIAGGYIVAFCAFVFGYTTLIGWAYDG